ncbi:MAG: ABC transporter permease [Promethearchaeota archaeon]|jgi:simple sugar transport system permease protein
MEAILFEIGEIINLAILAGTAILIATLGEIFAERSGILNLGIEGMMIMGSITAYVITYLTHNPWIGLIMAMLIGALFSLIHAFISITLKGNQTVSGLALTMLGLGISAVIGKYYDDSIVSVTVNEYAFSPIAVPFLSDIPILGPTFFSGDPIVYIGLIISLILWFFLFKTKHGLTIRAVGENPIVADTLGINVYRVQYLCVMLGGSLAGLAGSHLTIAYTSTWVEGITQGKGWIAVGLTIFALWNPIRALIGSYLFGLIDILQYRLQPYGVAPSILAMFPYIFTIIALLIGTSKRMKKRKKAPAALGVPYIRGEKE